MERITACNDSGTQPVEETLGPAGGTIVSADGDATLSVPATALLSHVVITVTAVDDGSLAGEALYVPGTAYRLRFILASGANARITDSNASVVSANETAIEIQVVP